MDVKFREKLVNCYTVLIFYNMVDETKGVRAEDAPESIRDEAELKAAERFAREEAQRRKELEV